MGCNVWKEEEEEGLGKEGYLRAHAQSRFSSFSSILNHLKGGLTRCHRPNRVFY